MIDRLKKIQIEELRRYWEDCDVQISIGNAIVLAYMAANDIWPDGTIGDNECCIWSEFRRIINAAKED